MSEHAQHNWTILGANPLAEALRAAAPFRPAPRPLTVVTEGAVRSADDFVLGPAVFASDNERYVPWHAAYEAVEAVKSALDAGDVGRRYGCFASFRLPRSERAEQVMFEALAPVVGTALDLLDTAPRRIWAARMSLLRPDDAWFATLTLVDETIVTLEALAVTDPAQGPELLIEVTGSHRVLRAEPLRQAVVVERVGSAPSVYPWLEDQAQRCLALLIRRSSQPAGNAGTRLRATWDAILRSAAIGEPVTAA